VPFWKSRHLAAWTSTAVSARLCLHAHSFAADGAGADAFYIPPGTLLPIGFARCESSVSGAGCDGRGVSVHPDKKTE